MINPIYEHTLMAGWVVLILLGVCLFFNRVPKKAVYITYNRSRRLTAATMIVFGIQLLLHWIFFFRIHTPYIATALNLTGFHIEAILFSMSQISLLNNRYIRKRQLRRDAMFCALTILVAWPSAILMTGTAQLVTMIAAAAIFLGHAIYLALVFFHTYRRAMHWIDNYYTEDIEAFVKWMFRSTIGFICYSLPGSMLAFCPQNHNTVYMMIIICLFTYIFISFQNYAVNYIQVETAVVGSPESDAIAEEEEVKEDIVEVDNELQPLIDKWIANGCYRKKGVTIDDLITLLHINRTYISHYINGIYHCNFREWITSLRMDYAKEQLLANPEFTIEQVAAKAGFSSSSYFCQQFTKREQATPNVWRNRQLHGDEASA